MTGRVNSKWPQRDWANSTYCVQHDGVRRGRYRSGLVSEVWGDQGGWGRPVQGLAGAVVELGRDGGELLGGVDGEVGAFGEVVAV